MIELRYLEGVATLTYDATLCIGCGMCPTVCPHGVFVLEQNEVGENVAVVTDRDRCMECGACAKNCPVNAISVTAGVGCASAIIYSWISGNPPSCDCEGGSSGCC